MSGINSYIDIAFTENEVLTLRGPKAISQSIKSFFILSPSDVPSFTRIFIGDLLHRILGSLLTTESLRTIENFLRSVILLYGNLDLLEVFDIQLERFSDRELLVKIFYKEISEPIEVFIPQIPVNIIEYKSEQYSSQTYEEILFSGDSLVSFVEMVHSVHPEWRLSRRKDGTYVLGDAFLLLSLQDGSPELQSILNILES